MTDSGGHSRNTLAQSKGAENADDQILPRRRDIKLLLLGTGESGKVSFEERD